MKGASTTSTRRRGRKAGGVLSTYPFDTVNTRGRKREARRWHDVLGARCTNGARQPHPLKVAELFKVYDRAMTELEQRDPVLFAAVHQCIWDQIVADDGITMDEWRRRALRRADRMNAIRRTLPPQLRLADLCYVKALNRRR
jgi:hypothetical protein